MLQLYRKLSDMTTRVITPPVEGTSDLCRAWKDTKDGGMRGFPGTLKGVMTPYLDPLFSEITIFLQKVKEIPLISLLVLINLVGCSA